MEKNRDYLDRHTTADTPLCLVYTEEESYELAKFACYIHAEGYLKEGFVTEGAITEDGCLDGSLDNARGKNVTYYLYINKNSDDVYEFGTLRKINSNGKLDELPAFKYVDDLTKLRLNDELKPHIADGRSIVEIAALSSSRGASPLVIYETLKNAYHDGVSANEMWVFCLVSKTYDSLVENLGQDVLKVIGEDIKFGDPRVSEDLSLKPIIFDPVKFLDNLHSTIAKGDGDSSKIIRSLLFFSDGLQQQYLGDDVVSLIKQIKR